MRNKFLLLLVISISLVMGLVLVKTGQGTRSPLNPSNSNFAVSEADRALTQEERWLNTARPLKSEDLAGRIVLVDFWTFCCINCMHVFPELHQLEKEFGKDLTVIGVHSAKFANEKETENIRSAILRYGIEHPVVNDADFKIWNSFGVNSWPTLVLIDPEGKIDRTYSGEGHLQDLREDISRLQKKFAGRLNSDALPLALEKSKTPPAELNFPGKLEYAEDLGLLFVSDSSNHRILGVKLTGEVGVEIGKKGESGRNDGGFSTARFNHPQGLLYHNHQLYVADTDNHLLRKIDLDKKQVTTLAGTGVQGFLRDPKNVPALQTSLSSPWDLAFYPSDQEIAVAMAGTHQIWSYNIPRQTLSVLAGNGRESIVDGAYPENSLSQPSGLSVAGGKLYFVDSETSSLRVLENGRVKTLIGSGLFDFGFKDGGKGQALLQHPLGLFADDSSVYIADSYNHALRRYDLSTGRLETLAGNGKAGKTEGDFAQLRLNEPNDVFKIGEKIFLTDTNNHRVLMLDPSTRLAQALPIKPSPGSPASALAAHLPNLKPTGEVQLGTISNIPVLLKLEEGWKLNAQAPSWAKLFQVKADGVSFIQSFPREDLLKKEFALPALKAGENYRLQGTFYFCREGQDALCYLQSLDQNLTVREGGRNSLEIVLKKDS